MEFKIIFLVEMLQKIKFAFYSLANLLLAILQIVFENIGFHYKVTTVSSVYVPKKRVRWTKETISPIPSREKIHKMLRKRDRKKNNENKDEKLPRTRSAFWRSMHIKQQ